MFSTEEKQAPIDTKEKFDNFHNATDDDGKWLAGRPFSLPVSKTSKPAAKESNRAFRLTTVTCVAAWFLVTRPCEAQIEVNAYISNLDSNSVSVIDTGSNTVISTLTLGIGPLPIGVAVTPR
jgi:YVTN family beta-propeller protein